MWLYEEIAERVRPYKDTILLCLESAADFLSLSNGTLYLCNITAYTSIDQKIDGFELRYLPDCFKSKQYIEREGIYCTTVEQTLLDLLEYEHDIDIQNLLESLSKYYYTHNETFNGLEKQMNSAQLQAFEKWKQDAIDYYTED